MFLISFPALRETLLYLFIYYSIIGTPYLSNYYTYLSIIFTTTFIHWKLSMKVWENGVSLWIWLHGKNNIQKSLPLDIIFTAKICFWDQQVRSFTHWLYF